MIMVKLANMAYKVANQGGLNKSDKDLLRTGIATAVLGAPAGVGYYRASQLTPDEAVELRRHYGKGDKPDLRMRGMGRTMAYGTGTGLAAGLAGGALGGVLGRGSFGKMTAAQLLGSAAMLAGTTAGTIHGSKKYSKKGLEQIRQQKKSE